MAVTTSVRTPSEHQRAFDPIVGDVVSRAAASSPGFRARLDRAGLDPADLDDVAALDALPVLTKDELLDQQLAAPPFGDLLAPDTTPVRIFQSPGPLYEPQLESGDTWRWQSALRAAGFDEHDVVLVAFGFHLSPAGAMFEAACHSLGATVVPAGVGSKELQVRACVDIGITAYVGPPSYLKALLETAEASGAEVGIERAFVSAEPLPPSLRAWLTRRVPSVRQGYGTAETGNLGWECDAQDGLHVPDDALVQICDLTTGAALHDDAQGQVVATLLSTEYPVVRFGTGDLSAWETRPCGCGHHAPRIRGWLGRVGDAVKVKGMFLHPRQVQSVMDGLAEVDAYRLVIGRKDHKDVLRCEVVADDPTDGERTQVAVAEAMREQLRFTVDVQLVGSLPDDSSAFEDVRTWE